MHTASSGRPLTANFDGYHIVAHGARVCEPVHDDPDRDVHDACLGYLGQIGHHADVRGLDLVEHLLRSSDLDLKALGDYLLHGVPVRQARIAEVRGRDLFCGDALDLDGDLGLRYARDVLDVVRDRDSVGVLKREGEVREVYGGDVDAVYAADDGGVAGDGDGARLDFDEGVFLRCAAP